MISVFRMGPATSGCRLRDIDTVLFTKSILRKFGSPCTVRYIFAIPGLPIFMTFDLVTLNSTLSISHSQHSNRKGHGNRMGPLRLCVLSPAREIQPDVIFISYKRDSIHSFFKPS